MRLLSAPTLAALTGVGVAAWLLGAAMWAVVEPAPAAQADRLRASAPAAAVTATGQPADRSLVATVTARDVFGAKAASAGPHAAPPAAPIEAVLLATVVADEPASSSALIAADDAPARGYAVGDRLHDQATIVGIDQMEVQLRRDDGRVERLRPDGMSQIAAPTAPRRDQGVSREELSAILENPDELRDELRAVPHGGPDGPVDGYRLSGIRSGSVLDRLGVRNGDVVHTLGGAPLTSPSDALAALRELRDAPSVQLEVTRRGRRHLLETALH